MLKSMILELPVQVQYSITLTRLLSGHAAAVSKVKWSLALEAEVKARGTINRLFAVLNSPVPTTLEYVLEVAKNSGYRFASLRELICFLRDTAVKKNLIRITPLLAIASRVPMTRLQHPFAPVLLANRQPTDLAMQSVAFQIPANYNFLVIRD